MTGGRIHDGTSAAAPDPGAVHSPPRGLKGAEVARCYSCQRSLPVAEFAPDPTKASGRKSICRPCDNDRSHRYYIANRERVIARVAAATKAAHQARKR